MTNNDISSDSATTILKELILFTIILMVKKMKENDGKSADEMTPKIEMKNDDLKKSLGSDLLGQQCQLILHIQ